MFRHLDAAWNGIDILINNAGIDGPSAVGWKADIVAWRKVIEVNLFGAFYCANEPLKRMVRQKKWRRLSTTSVHEENRLVWTQRLYGQQGGGQHVDENSGTGSRSSRGGACWRLGPGAIKTSESNSLRVEQSQKHERPAGENPVETDWRARTKSRAWSWCSFRTRPLM